MKALLIAVAGAALLAGIGAAQAALVSPPHVSTKPPIDWSQVFAAEREQIAHLRLLPITCAAVADAGTGDHGTIEGSPVIVGFGEMPPVSDWLLGFYATPDTSTVGDVVAGDAQIDLPEAKAFTDDRLY